MSSKDLTPLDILVKSVAIVSDIAIVPHTERAVASFTIAPLTVAKLESAPNIPENSLTPFARSAN